MEKRMMIILASIYLVDIQADACSFFFFQSNEFN